MDLLRAHLGIALLAVITAGCGRFGYAGPDVDAAYYIPNDGGPDGGPDAGCTLGDWEAPTMLTIGGTSTANFFGGPGPTADRLTLYFSMEPSGGNEHLWVATRADVESSTFGTATALATIASLGIEGSPFPSSDELTLYYFADPGGSGPNARQLYYATRASTGATFGNPTLMPNVNASGVDQGPRTTTDGLTLVWSSDRAGGSGQEDLYLGTRASTAVDFALARRISELATSGRDQGGSFGDGGLSLYFASSRSGTLGGLDLWSAARADTGAATTFGTPAHLNNVNSTSNEFDAVITADGMELFFASDRGGPTRLYHSLRHCVP